MSAGVEQEDTRGVSYPMAGVARSPGDIPSLQYCHQAATSMPLQALCHGCKPCWGHTAFAQEVTLSSIKASRNQHQLRSKLGEDGLQDQIKGRQVVRITNAFAGPRNVYCVPCTLSAVCRQHKVWAHC
jgi:hypothetical protein